MDWLQILDYVLGGVVSICAIIWANIRTNPKHLEKVQQKSTLKQTKAKEKLIEHLATDLINLTADDFREIIKKVEEKQNGEAQENRCN